MGTLHERLLQWLHARFVISVCGRHDTPAGPPLAGVCDSSDRRKLATWQIASGAVLDLVCHSSCCNPSCNPWRAVLMGVGFARIPATHAYASYPMDCHHGVVVVGGA